MSKRRSPADFATTIARWSGLRPEQFNTTHPRASEGKSTDTLRRRFAKDSWTLLVQAAIFSPSWMDKENTSLRHSASKSCCSLSGNLSSSNFHMCLSPSSSTNWESVKCSTVSRARPSRRVKTHGPFCFLSKSFSDAILASHHRRHLRSSRPSKDSPENLLYWPPWPSFL